MDEKSKKEYRVKSVFRDDSVTPDPGLAGQRFRAARKCRISGESIELQERDVSPWRTVEKIEGTI
jgi:hypothetical protein